MSSDGDRAPRTGVARQVPAPRRPAGPEDDRAGLDGARAPARRATSRSAPPRPGCATCSTRLAAARCRGWSRRARRSPTPRRVAALLEHDRDCKPSTLRDYRSTRRPTCCRRSASCGSRTSRAERIERVEARRLRRLSNRTKIKLPDRAARRSSCAPEACTGCRRTRWPSVEQPRAARDRPTSQVFSPEEVWALVRAADCEQDAAIFLTAAFTGLRRGELVALRWRDVDFARPAIRVSRELRRRPADDAEVAARSARCRWRPTSPRRSRGSASASCWTGDDDLVFPGVPAATSTAPRCAAATGGAAARRPAAAALPRPAPHVRHARDRQGRHPPRPGVDGPRRHPDDDEVPALRRTPRRGRARGRGLRH